jgi:hypothetical protein
MPHLRRTRSRKVELPQHSSGLGYKRKHSNADKESCNMRQSNVSGDTKRPKITQAEAGEKPSPQDPPGVSKRIHRLRNHLRNQPQNRLHQLTRSNARIASRPREVLSSPPHSSGGHICKSSIQTTTTRIYHTLNWQRSIIYLERKPITRLIQKR